jgi:filamentous hemagglutinin
MSIYKRVAGNLVIQTVGATDTVTFEGLTANAATVIIDGDLTVSGNASLTGNISGDKIFNGTTSIEIPVASGNALISVGGASNVVVVTSTGANVAGTANITGAVSTGSTLSAVGNITGANLNTAGNVWITRDASAAQPTIRFTDTDTEVADGQVLGAVEWVTSDVSGSGARVTSAIRSIAAGTLGNANVQILTSTNGAAPTAKVTVDNVGNVGVANSAPLHTLAVSGTMYGSTTLDVVGNVTGGNLLTGGSATATGNIVGGNIATAGLVTVTGNITGGNIASLGVITAGAPGVTATGNVRGGNLVSDGDIVATGNIDGSNLFTQGQVSATGNVIANNASFGGNVSVTQNATTANLVVTNLSSGTGIGVENIVWQNSDFTIESATMANVGVLTFTALENQAYKFEAYLPAVPEGSTTTAFSVLFDNGSCNYTLETQTTPTATWAVASSTTSDSTGTTQNMTGTDMRTVRITGTFAHTGNTAVSIRAQTSASNVLIKTGAHLTYTRIG